MPRFRIICAQVLVVLALVCVGSAASSQADLEERIDSYFSELVVRLGIIASDPLVQSASPTEVDDALASALVDQDCIYSLIRTNAKGTVVSEAIRGRRTERTSRNVGNQAWFRELVGTKQEYHGFIRSRKEGRYLAFWCVPVFTETGSGAELFAGALSAKIDLAECFREFVSDSDVPLLVNVGSVEVFSSKWDGIDDYEEREVAIPGVEDVSVRFERVQTPPPSADSTGDDSSLGAAPMVAMLESPDLPTVSSTPLRLSGAVREALGRNAKLVKVCAFVAVLGMAFLIFRFIVWCRHKLVMRRIDRKGY